MSNFSSSAKTISMTSRDSAPNSSRRVSGVSFSTGSLSDCAMIDRTSSIIATAAPRGVTDLHRSERQSPATPLFDTRRLISSFPLQLVLQSRPSSNVRIATVDDGMSPFGTGIERSFQRAARLFKRFCIGGGGNADRLADDDSAAAERQIHFRAVPVVENDAAAGRQRNRKDRPAGFACKL